MEGSRLKWITREHVKVDRVSCPWLIRKILDPQAEFSFVPSGSSDEPAQKLGAVPFDVPAVNWVTTQGMFFEVGF